VGLFTQGVSTKTLAAAKKALSGPDEVLAVAVGLSGIPTDSINRHVTDGINQIERLGYHLTFQVAYTGDGGRPMLLLTFRRTATVTNL
jgi:hypothetical protein